jgi:hypothetical protein
MRVSAVVHKARKQREAGFNVSGLDGSTDVGLQWV